MTKFSGRLRGADAAAGLLVTVLATIGSGGIASAQTDFDGSVPTDAAVVDGPLSEVVISFTNPAEPAGEGFELLDPSGAVRPPTSVDATDGTSFILAFDPPLEAGVYGVRWKVRAGDAHPIDGTFTFEVTVPVVVTVPVATTTPVAAVDDVDPPSIDGAAATAGSMSS